MGSAGKMTPGPWKLEVGKEGYFITVYGWPLATVCRRHPDSSEAAMEEGANARAIACLPELVKAARRLTMAGSSADAWADLEELRRILARIDGGDHAE